MRRELFLIVFLLLGTTSVFSQVGIGTTSPNASLDIQASNTASPSNTDGVLIPKIDDFPSSNPGSNQDGMLVYVTGNSTPTKGFYYWNHTTTSWVNIQGSGAEKINELTDAKSDDDGSNNGSSIFFGVNAGVNDDSSNNQNVGIGYEALQSNDEGSSNVAIGYGALTTNIIGNENTSLGFQSMINNVGSNNTAIGSFAMRDNTSGENNVAIGHSALNDNESGINNVAIGYQAGFFETGSNKLYIENSTSTTPLIYGEFDNDFLQVNGTLNINGVYNFPSTAGTSNQILVYNGSGSLSWLNVSDVDDDSINNLSDGKTNAANNSIFLGQSAGLNDSGSTLYNIGIGLSALQSNTAGEENIALGYNSLFSNTNGNRNIAVGSLALNDNTEGLDNLGIGYSSLTSNTTGSFNVAVGSSSLANNDDGSMNAAFGYNAIRNNTTGTHNVAVGGQALQQNETGIGNIAMGWLSMFSNTSGFYNVGIGVGALRDNNGTYNTSIGATSLASNAGGSYNVSIGFGAGANNSGSRNVFIGSEAGANETGSNKLYIENSNATSTSALIYGDFSSNELSLNAATDINGRTEITNTTDANGAAGSGALEIANSLRIDGNEIITNTGTTLFMQADNNTDLDMDGGTFRLDASNNRIGVGTTSPDYRFSVNGVANLNEGVSSGIALRVNGTEALWYNGTYFSWGFGGQDNYFADPIGIGPADPVTRLQITGGIDASLTNHGYFVLGDVTGLNIVIDNNEIMARNNGAASDLLLQNDGGVVRVGGAIVLTSDRRLKKDIQPLSYGLDEVLQLEPKAYFWKNQPNAKEKSLGLIAQEVQKILPEIVKSSKDKNDYLGVNYTELIPVLINAIQTQQETINDLKSKLKIQQSRFISLESRLDQIEAQLNN